MTLYKITPNSKTRRYGYLVEDGPPEFPEHTLSSLAEAFRQSFPDLSVYEMESASFIIVCASWFASELSIHRPHALG